MSNYKLRRISKSLHLAEVAKASRQYAFSTWNFSILIWENKVLRTLDLLLISLHL